MALTQSHYRFGIDQLTESTHGWYANQDTSPQQGALPLDAPFLLRFCVQANATGLNNVDFEFQYRRNGGTWTNITTTSTVVKAVAATALTNGGNCTKQLSGTGTFESTGAGQTETGVSGGANNDIVSNGNSETECGLQIVSANVTSGDTLEFRLTRDGGVLLDTYAVTPSYQLATPPQAVLITGVQGGNPLRFLMAPGNGIDPEFDNTGMPSISSDWGSTSLAIVLGANPPTGAALRGKMYLNSTVGYRVNFETYLASVAMASGTFMSVCVGKEINALDFDDASVLIAWYLRLENVGGTLKFRFSFPTATGEQFNDWSGTVSANTTYKHEIEYNLVTDRIIYKVNDELVCNWAMDGSAVQSIGTIVMGSSGGSTARDTVMLIDRIVEQPINYISTGITTAQTGVAGTGSVGTLTADAGSQGATLVGAGAASAIGAFALGVTIALAGVGGTASSGTLTPARTISAIGQAATGAVGSLAETSSRGVSGVAGTGAVGTAAPSTSNALTGVAGTGSVGTISASSDSSTSVALTGVTASGALGTVTPTRASTVSGVSATGAPGVVTPGLSRAASGLAGTGATGAVPSTASVAGVGTAATGAVGTMSTGSAGQVTLTGQAGTGSTGTLTSTVTKAVTSTNGTGAVGTVTAVSGYSAALSGVAATGATAGPTTDSVLVSSGVAGTGALGVLAAVDGTIRPQSRQATIWRSNRASAVVSENARRSVLVEA